MKVYFESDTVDSCINSLLEDLSQLMNKHVLASSNSINLQLPDRNFLNKGGVTAKCKVTIEFFRPGDE